MTPAELKTLREAIGLSVTDLAALASVQERTVRYWEAGRNQVPADVAELVTGIDTMLDQQVDRAADTVRELISETRDKPKEVVLLRYRENGDLWHFQPGFRPLPTTTHGALLVRTRAALADLHVRTRIVYMHPQAYAMWRGERHDSESVRAEWAARQET